MHVGWAQSAIRATGDAEDARERLGGDVADVDMSEADEYEALLQGVQNADDGVEKYKVSLDPADPIVQSLLGPRVGAKEVRSFELLESRWNGNELLKYETDIGPFCVKMNRVEPTQVFMAESLGLVTMAKATPLVRAPKPLDIGALPKVGDFGPGSFLVMEWIQAVPFAVLRSENQKRLGAIVAEMHTASDAAFAEVHKGRFGFPVNNWLSLNAQVNDWQDSWASFFVMRLQRLLDRAYSSPSYAGAAEDDTSQKPLLSSEEEALRVVFADVCKLVPQALGPERLPTLRPSLLHGDLWIGNVLADKEGPVLIDPASFFGHSEMELSIMSLFGGFTPDFYEAYHERIPKADGFEERQLFYKAYHWLNQFVLFGDPRAKDEAISLATQLLEQESE